MDPAAQRAGKQRGNGTEGGFIGRGAAGAVFGAVAVNLLPELFRNFGDYRLFVYGVILLLMILYQPNGVFSIGRRLARRA